MTTTQRLFAVLALSISATVPTQAAEMAWGTKKVVYSAVEPKDLRVFLRDFAAQQGVGVFVDPEVKGELTGSFDLSPRSMMELLGRKFGLMWYFDGRVLYVYPSTAVESSIIRLSKATPEQFQRTLDRLGIADTRYPVSFDGTRGSAMVSGPKRYVELVKQAASTSDRNGDNNTDDGSTSIRVISLKYAFAADYSVNSGGKEFRMPGVVTVLRQAFNGELQGPLIGDGRRTGLNPRRPVGDPGESNGGGNNTANAGGKNAGDKSAGEKSAGDNSDRSNTNPLLPMLDGRGGKSNGGASKPGLLEGLLDRGESDNSGSSARGVPSFSADPRTNAVIVRDVPSRIEQYEAVIKRLDEQPRLVELETNIVEINSEDFSELGIDWRAMGRRGQIEVGGGGIANSVTQPNGVAPNLNGNSLQSLGNIAGTVLGVMTGGRTQLLARISALEQARKATVSAQPKVMTLNNVEVALDAIETFYVPVGGYQSSQLFDVSAGTSIRLTPSVIGADAPAAGVKEAEKDMVRLLIKIEDGNITGQKVSALPTVKRMTIDTQSLIPDGSTLLIAGYSKEIESRDQNGVPVLSSVPVFGNLFKSTAKNRTRVERLFMITPRVVDVRTAQTAQPLQMLPSGQDAAPPAQRAAADAAPSPAPAAVIVRPGRESQPAAVPAPAVAVVSAPTAASAPVVAAASASVPAPAVAAAPAPAPAAQPSPAPAPVAAPMSVPPPTATYALGLSPARLPVAPAPPASANAAASARAGNVNPRTDPPPGASQAAWALGFGAPRPAAAASAATPRNDANGPR
jgi:type III secretion protein C